MAKRVVQKNSDWPFDDPPNFAVLTVRGVMERGEAIVLVTHDAEDQMWEFLPQSGANMEEAMVVGLEEVVALEPALIELADLPLGWTATRARRGARWVRKQRP